LIRLPYDAIKADVWALGVCLYKCVSGNFPFTGVNENDLYSKIKKGLKNLPNHFSKGMQTLIEGLMEIDPEKRITVEQALESPWFFDISFHDLSTKSIST
jgi:5'-AMP-activated protein kinase, catalytic alpha subunit